MKEHPKILTKNIGFADQHTIAGYESRGGYSSIKKALAMTADSVIEEVKKDNIFCLRGRVLHD